MEFVPGLDIPDYNRCICATGDEHVKTAGETDVEHAFYKVGVASESKPGAAGGGGPGPDCFVPAACIDNMLRRWGEC